MPCLIFDVPLSETESQMSVDVPVRQRFRTFPWRFPFFRSIAWLAVSCSSHASDLKPTARLKRCRQRSVILNRKSAMLFVWLLRVRQGKYSMLPGNPSLALSLYLPLSLYLSLFSSCLSLFLSSLESRKFHSLFFGPPQFLCGAEHRTCCSRGEELIRKADELSRNGELSS